MFNDIDIKCPCCGGMLVVKQYFKLPPGYDDPAHPISMCRPEDVKQLVCLIEKKETKTEDTRE